MLDKRIIVLIIMALCIVWAYGSMMAAATGYYGLSAAIVSGGILVMGIAWEACLMFRYRQGVAWILLPFWQVRFVKREEEKYYFYILSARNFLVGLGLIIAGAWYSYYFLFLL